MNLNNRSVLGIHPGSGLDQGAVKRFPIAQYKVFISEFLKIYPNARILVFIGPAEATMSSIFEEIDNRVLVVMDRSLSVVTALIERLCVMLAGDSGLAHIASAVGTPVVTLAGPTRIEQTKPFGEKNIVIKTKEKLDCMPCHGTPLFENCPFEVRCMRGISVKEMVDCFASWF